MKGIMRPWTAVSAALLCGAAMAAHALENEGGIKLRLAGYAEGDPLLTGNPDNESREAYLDLKTVLHTRFSPNNATFIKLQGFLPTGEVFVNEDETPQRSDGFFAVRELWWEYGGLTSYPGEVLRIGRQRLREYDGLWWDQDIEALRWIFDTTLLDIHFGVAEQLFTARSDESEVNRNQRDRGYVFGAVDGEFAPGHAFGIRSAYALDHVDLDEQQREEEDPKTVKRRMGWAGLHVDNGFHTYKHDDPLKYWSEVRLQTGNADYAVFDDLGNYLGTRRQDVEALSADAGLRIRLDAGLPLQFGIAYAYGQGGGDAQTDTSFEQTGLHSNRSRFTGTRSLMHRFNEALQAELSNLHVATVFSSLQLDAMDFSLVYHDFRRDDREQDIEADGIDIAPVNADSDIGQGLDLVLTRYFSGMPMVETVDEDLRSNIRLRASGFRPGEAYRGNGREPEDQYRAMLEWTTWF